MGNIQIQLQGGTATESFECTGCERAFGKGSECLTVSVLDGFFGPLCVDCWPKVPQFLDVVAANPGISIDGLDAIKQEVEARYREAKAQSN